MLWRNERSCLIQIFSPFVSATALPFDSVDVVGLHRGAFLYCDDHILCKCWRKGK